MSIRAIKLEIVKPTSESWDEAGTTMRLLTKVTPKLLRAGYDARIAGSVCGRDALKASVAPDAKAASNDGLAYQAVLREIERLQAWGGRKRNSFSALDVPGGMSSAIARAASQAFARRDQGRIRFESERILVRKQECGVSRDGRDILLRVKLRSAGRVTFLCAWSYGVHRQTVDAIVRGAIPHGDCKIHYDDRRRKWFAHLSYEGGDVAPVSVDPSRALAVHRGVRSALYMITSTGKSVPWSGAKYVHQRRQLQARMREARRIEAVALGAGAKGHGKRRRYEHLGALEGKLDRATKTFLQQCGARVVEIAKRGGFGLVVIEDYGGIAESPDPMMRRILDRFPLAALKKAIVYACTREGITVHEAASDYISSTCPVCEHADTRQHNTRTGIFHCKASCGFSRPADWVAAYWMMRHSGVDTSILDEQLRRQRELSAVAGGIKR